MNFNELIERKGTNSVKWDNLSQYQEPDLLPMWIADMDFSSPPTVLKKLHELVDNRVLGYPLPSEALYQSIINWEHEKNGYHLKQQNILLIQGVVPGLVITIRAFTNPGDGVMIFDPVYPPFSAIVTNSKRLLYRSKLINDGTTYKINFNNVEQLFKTEKVKLLLLCNPHNPGGVVWSKRDLLKLSSLAAKYDVLIASDEIHSDLIYSDHSYTSMMNLNPSCDDRLIVLTSVTKTFNLAGTKVAFMFVKDHRLHQKLERIIMDEVQDHLNTFGLVAAQTAYETGNEWLTELLGYLESNRNYAMTYLQDKTMIKPMLPGASYLMWLDFSTYKHSDEELHDLLIHHAKILLNPGDSFGPGGSQFMRLNFAVPRKQLEEGLHRISSVFRTHNNLDT